MSDRLKLAFEEASKLPEQEQNAFADFLLAGLNDEQKWAPQNSTPKERQTPSAP